MNGLPLPTNITRNHYISTMLSKNMLMRQPLEEWCPYYIFKDIGNSCSHGLTKNTLGAVQKSYHSPEGGGVNPEREKVLFYSIFNWKNY